jgi:hypothetical protein
LEIVEADLQRPSVALDAIDPRFRIRFEPDLPPPQFGFEKLRNLLAHHDLAPPAIDKADGRKTSWRYS